jgi:hypothetical protein
MYRIIRNDVQDINIEGIINSEYQSYVETKEPLSKDAQELSDAWRLVVERLMLFGVLESVESGGGSDETSLSGKERSGATPPSRNDQTGFKLCNECNLKVMAEMCRNRIGGVAQGNCMLNKRVRCGDLVLGCEDFKCRIAGACERAYLLGVAFAAGEGEK